MSDASDESLRDLLDVDRMVHEPARLAILTVLAEAEEVEFRFMETVTGLTRGNLSSHASRLEAAGYIEVRKTFRGRTPVTSYRITDTGRRALHGYRAHLHAALTTGSSRSRPSPP